jgi:hypothetical protein
MPTPTPMPVGPRGCGARKRDGALCTQPAISGTVRCRMHAGVPAAQAKAKGAVVVELSRWGITDKTLDPGLTLLQLMTQSFQRAKLYGQLLEEAYEAAERLQGADATVDAMHDVEGDGLPGHVDSGADRDRAVQDLQRIFATGGVSALIGHTYSSAEGAGVFATGEAIRGLVQLEAQERDRAAGMAAKAVAAGLATRQVELAERQGALVADLIRALFADPELGLTAEQAAAAPAVAARHLRALSAGGVSA